MTVTLEETTVLTPEKALELLRKARDLKGADYVYKPETLSATGHRLDGCKYLEPDGSPSCIVGHVFVWAGIAEIEEDRDADSLASEYGLPDVVGDILATAQAEQDSGLTWGEAVEAAERKARKHGVTA